MIIEGNHITAEEGKVIRRISDGFVYGKEVYLGYTYYIDGKLLPEPHLETPEEMEEIDEPVYEQENQEEPEPQAQEV